MKEPIRNGGKPDPLVSIIIPTYNRKELLPGAVTSCLNQTWINVEVLVIDDGSADGTDAFVERQTKDGWRRVKYRRQSNKGASSARNMGLKSAQGEYIQFLDSDDLLYSTKIADQVSVLQQPENQSAPCCYCFGDMGPSPPAEGAQRLKQIGYGSTDPKALIRELCSRRVHGMQTSAPLWRRSFLLSRAGWREDVVLGDDLEYHIRILAEASRICFIGKSLFFVQEHLGSRLSTDPMSRQSLLSLVRTREAIFETLRKFGLWDIRTQRIFLDAMRTIYANALDLGDQECIRNIEDWLWQLASAPRPVRTFHALILLRRILGSQFLLRTHKLMKKCASR